MCFIRRSFSALVGTTSALEIYRDLFGGLSLVDRRIFSALRVYHECTWGISSLR